MEFTQSQLLEEIIVNKGGNPSFSDSEINYQSDQDD